MNNSENFLTILEDRIKNAKKNRAKSIVLRFSNSYGFFEVDPNYLKSVIDSAKNTIVIAQSGIDEISELEKFALIVLKDLSER
jgi:hypothetical protein